jgi:hypothetical protein
LQPVNNASERRRRDKSGKSAVLRSAPIPKERAKKVGIFIRIHLAKIGALFFWA